MWRLLNWLFGFDYVFIENSARSMICRVNHLNNGCKSFQPYSFKVVIIDDHIDIKGSNYKNWLVVPLTKGVTKNPMFSMISLPVNTNIEFENQWCPVKNGSPKMGNPVVGFHTDWINEDFNIKGTRECFVYGDGTEWISAYFNGESDEYESVIGPPECWIDCGSPTNKDQIKL